MQFPNQHLKLQGMGSAMSATRCRYVPHEILGKNWFSEELRLSGIFHLETSE